MKALILSMCGGYEIQRWSPSATVLFTLRSFIPRTQAESERATHAGILMQVRESATSCRMTGLSTTTALVFPRLPMLAWRKGLFFRVERQEPAAEQWRSSECYTSLEYGRIGKVHARTISRWVWRASSDGATR